MTGYVVIVAPVAVLCIVAVAVAVRLLRPHPGSRAAPDPVGTWYSEEPYNPGAVTVVRAAGDPPWEQAVAPEPAEPGGLGTWEPRLRDALAAEVDGLEPEQLEPDDMERRLRSNDLAELGLAPEPVLEQLEQLNLPPHVAAMAAAAREQHVRSCPTCLVEQRPWYDPSWLNTQTGLLFEWVRRVHREL